MILRCKSCGSNIRYDIGLGRLYCEYCGNSFMPKEYEDTEETFDAVTYTCGSCGAELITTEDTEATAFCSFCGSASILKGRLEKIKKPDGILPFRITREKCREIYMRQAKEAFLAPRWMEEENCVDSFRAIYMPYWYYRLHAKGVVKRETETKDTRDGNYIITTITKYEDAQIDMDITGWSHDAANSFADDISEALGFAEMWEKEFLPFHSGYMSGFYADMAEEACEKHKKIAAQEAKAQLEEREKGTFTGEISVNEHKLYYMPVWFMSMRNGEDRSYAAINGYSGKIVADFPISSRGFFTIAGIAAAALAVFLSMVLVLRPEPAFWISAVLTAVGLIVCGKEENRLRDVGEMTGHIKPDRYLDIEFVYKENVMIGLILTVMLWLIAIISAVTSSYTMRLNIGILGTPVIWISVAIDGKGKKKPKKISIPYRLLWSFLLSIGAGLLLLTRNNLIIYGAVLILAVILCYNILKAFGIHQKIARRRPPQLDRKGAGKDA